jgi:SNF2 family DNA or RNA helicase
VVTAVNAAAASGKCRQVASGGLYTQEGGKRKSLKIHDEKTDVLKDLVDELQGQPLLVSYEFDHDFDRIQKALGKVPAINGHTKASKAQEIIVAWNQGEIPVLAGHPAAMGHGLNLQGGGCSHICFYSLTWDFELYDQLVRRVYRQGSIAKRVVVHRLLARDTLDEVVAQVLGSKKRSQNALFEALKRLKR